MSGFEIHEDVSHIPEADRMQVDDQDETYGIEGGSRRDVLSPSRANATRKAQISASSAKLQKHIQSPRTPRHRDALSKRSPVTPRHRVTLGGIAFTPRTPRTPRGSRVSTPSSRSVYEDAKRCLSSSAGGENEKTRIIGRDNERGELQSFISTCMGSARNGALYVSGPPGTGKSALISEVTGSLTLPDTVKRAYLNCMSVKSANDLYHTLLSELGISDDMFDAKTQKTLSAAVLQKQSETTYLVVLDEIDALLDIDINVLYNMFEWALHSSSNMILIGIANALDLTDRFLPKLRARGLKPQLLPFLPYTPADISSVLTSRLRSLLPRETSVSDTFTPCLMPAAIQLISKKVAAQTGDLRKAFDLAQRAIVVIEAETKTEMIKEQQNATQPSPSKVPLGENANLSSPKSYIGSPTKSHDSARFSLSTLTAEIAPRASIGHVVRVTSEAFNNGTRERLTALNLQQKAVLCSLAALVQYNQRLQDRADCDSDVLSQPRTGLLPTPSATPSKKRVKVVPGTPTKRNTGGAAPKIREVYEAYGALCTREDLLSALAYSEFRDVVCNLETMGLLTAADGKAGSFVQIATPSRKQRGSGNALGTAIEDRRVHGTAGIEELKASLESAGAVRHMLERMLDGRDL